MLSAKDVARFLKGFDKGQEDECWEWKFSRIGKGYGQFKNTECGNYAHRFSYLLHNGPITDGLYVMHTCDNRLCVNPNHLKLGTCADNLQDMKNKDRHLRGERNAKSKLTESQVIEIHELHEQGMSTHKLAKRFNIGQMTAWRIVNGHRWEHIYKQRHGTNDPV
jgi:hypothetical protein